MQFSESTVGIPTRGSLWSRSEALRAIRARLKLKALLHALYVKRRNRGCQSIEWSFVGWFVHSNSKLCMAVARFCDKNGNFDMQKLEMIVSSEKDSSKIRLQSLCLILNIF
jgi:hypothetical protein